MDTHEHFRYQRRLLLKSIIAVGATCATCAIPAVGSDRGTAVIVSRCVGCRDCVKICPKNAIRFHAGKAEINPEKCINCRLCQAICSYGAITTWTN